MTTKTIDRPSNTEALDLALRGGPFTPDEYSTLETLTPAERSAMRYRRVLSQPSPEALEIARAVDARYGEKLRAAERDLEAAIAAREAATEAMFVARDALQAVSSTTWITGGGGGGMYERGGTAGQIEAATAQLEDAERDMKQARQTEEAAREKLSAIGAAANALARALGAERALGKK